MNLVQWARRGRFGTRASPANVWQPITLDQLPFWFGQFGYQGLGYGPSMIQTIQQNRETIAADFMGFINGAYKTNGAIFACMLCRMFLFSEARMQYRRLNNGRPGILFGTKDLDILEHPWPNATTGDLLTKAILDVDLAGNFYCTRVPRLNERGSKIARLRPDWVTIIKGTNEDPGLQNAWDPTAELVGYMYSPGGAGSGLKPKFYLPHEVAHMAPIPDPIASYRGMSWVQPILTEVLGDKAMATHKVMFFENGATPNLVISLEGVAKDRKTFQEWIDLVENEHSGALNAFKTLYLAGGASATVVGANLKDLDYSAVQGSTELRICSAAGIPPMILGFDRGLDASTLANFGQARRLLADRTMRPLWRNFCGSMETICPAPPGAQLWYDDRDIAFLQDDQSDNANVLLTKSTAMRLLVDAGFDPDSIVDAIESSDLSKLTHSGMYSVQLHPPGANGGPPQNGATGGTQKQMGSGSGAIGQASAARDPMELAQLLLAERAA